MNDFRKYRVQLIEEFDNKCAYCNSTLGVTHPGNIEHFYPKSLYPDRMLDIDNMLLSCAICDMSKGVKFPVDEAGEPLLIHPRKEKLLDHIQIGEDGVATAKTEKGKVSIDILNLNRSALVERRRMENIKNQYYSQYEKNLPDAYQVFKGSIEKIKSLNNLEIAEKEGVISYLNNMLYSNIITALEAYLSDAFISKVKSKKVHLRRFVETFHDYKYEKFELREIFERFEVIEVKAISSMQDVIFHNLPKVKRMYEDSLNIELPEIGQISKEVLTRHDLVHRNGKNIDGEEHKITKASISEFCDVVVKFVEKVNQSLEKV